MNSKTTDIIIPLWQGTLEEEINISISSLKKEIELINTVIIVCDGENSFFKKLKENNVRVEIKVYKGLMHGFLTMGGAIKEVKSVISFINKKINNYL